MQLSIIIPAYNVESYIEECLVSCYNQIKDCNDFEVIIINDGSTDTTLSILEEFSRKHNYSNLSIYNQPNKGLSATRNRGLELAKGKYIWFVDSDDTIQKDSLSDIFEKISLHPDLIVLSTLLNNNNHLQTIQRNLPQYEITGDYTFKHSYIYPYSGVQFYVFSKALLDQYGIHFKEGVYFEDMIFTPFVLSVAKCCYAIERPSYVYRIRQNSITSSKISDKKLIDMLSVGTCLYEQTKNSSVLYTNILYTSVCKIYDEYFFALLKMSRADRRKYIDQLNNSNFKNSVSKSNIKHKFHYFIILLFIYFKI